MNPLEYSKYLIRTHNDDVEFAKKVARNAAALSENKIEKTFNTEVFQHLEVKSSKGYNK